jgi:hypothetical protein
MEKILHCRYLITLQLNPEEVRNARLINSLTGIAEKAARQMQGVGSRAQGLAAL